MPKLTLNMQNYEFCDDAGNLLFEAPLLEVAYLIGSTQAGLGAEISLQEKFTKTAESISSHFKLAKPLPWFAAMQLTRQVESEVESLKKTEDT